MSLRRFGLALCALAFGVGLPLAALSAWNWHRLDGEFLGAELEKVVARAERLREGARIDYQDATLRALPPNPLTGAVHRLDDHLEDAAVLCEPASGAAGRSGIVFAFELDDRIPFAPAAGRSTLAQGDGALAVVHGEGDYLESTAIMDVPMDDVGDVVIRAKLQRGTHGLAWSTEQEPADPWFSRLDIPVVSTGAFHTYVINAKNAMKRGVREGDHIRRLYVRASGVAGDRVEIDFIRFLSKRTQVGLAEGRETQRFRDRVTLSEEPDLLDKTNPWRNRGLRVTGSFFYRGRHFVTSRRFWPGRGYWPELFRMKVYDVEADRLATSPLRAFTVDLHMHYRFARLLNDTLEHGRAAWRQWTEAESQSDHRFDPDALDQLRALGYIE